jgi:gamma-glutamyltranspeptidase
VRVEEGGIPASWAEQLKAMGHALDLGGSQGRAHIIMVDPLTGDRLGAPDRRDADGGAAGH